MILGVYKILCYSKISFKINYIINYILNMFLFVYPCTLLNISLRYTGYFTFYSVKNRFLNGKNYDIFKKGKATFYVFFYKVLSYIFHLLQLILAHSFLNCVRIEHFVYIKNLLLNTHQLFTFEDRINTQLLCCIYSAILLCARLPSNLQINKTFNTLIFKFASFKNFVTVLIQYYLKAIIRLNYK